MTLCHSPLKEAPLKPPLPLNLMPGPPVTFTASVHMETHHTSLFFTLALFRGALLYKNRHSIHTLCPFHSSKQLPHGSPEALGCMHQEHGLYSRRWGLRWKPTCAGPGGCLNHPRKENAIVLTCSTLLKSEGFKLCKSVSVISWVLAPAAEGGPMKRTSLCLGIKSWPPPFHLHLIFLSYKTKIKGKYSRSKSYTKNETDKLC